MIVTVEYVKTEFLRPGMQVRHGSKVETIGKYTGACEHGIHFGSGCYDLISTWEVVETLDLKLIRKVIEAIGS